MDGQLKGTEKKGPHLQTGPVGTGSGSVPEPSDIGLQRQKEDGSDNVLKGNEGISQQYEALSTQGRFKPCHGENR